MTFEGLQCLLIEHLKGLVRGGVITERGFARQLGVSQPHMHNLLKGRRELTVPVADRILNRLGISVLDLPTPFQLEQACQAREIRLGNTTSVPLVAGALGPDQPWPELGRVLTHVRIERSQLGMVHEPVLVSVASDPCLRGVQPALMALLDTHPLARLRFEPTRWYALRINGCGAIRQLRPTSDGGFRSVEQYEINAQPNEILISGSPSGWLESVCGLVVWIGEDLRSQPVLGQLGRFLVDPTSL